MKNLSIRKFRSYLLTLSLFSVTLIGFNNCGKFTTVSEVSEEFSSFASSEDGEDIELPFALLSAEQTLSSMLKATGQDSLSPAGSLEYTARYGSLAAGNNLALVNSPLILGTTSLAGEICNDLIKKEKAIAIASNRSFFESINFSNGVSSITAGAFSVTIRRMARSFWGRNEQNNELDLFHQHKMEFLQSLGAGDASKAISTDTLMLSTCTAILSSLDAITY